MSPWRILIVIVGGIAGLVLGVVGTSYLWNWLTDARPEDFTAGLVALVVGAPVGTFLGVFIAGAVYDRLSPPPPKS